MTAAAIEVMLPQNVEAEENVLGALLLAGTHDASQHVNDVRATGLQPTHFYRASHGRLYGLIVQLVDEGKPFDSLSVAARLPAGIDITSDRVHELSTIVPAISLAPHHARLVIEASSRYRAFTLGEKLKTAALNGGVPGELISEIAQLHDAADGQQVERPKIVSLADFAAHKEDEQPPLVGRIGEVFLPVGGLLIMGGEGGASKTTLTLDAVAHVCSGRPWMGYETVRPLRALLIENEGPRQQFRRKLEEKLEAWDGPDFRPNVFVWEEPWAAFDFRLEPHRRHLREFAREAKIDLVVADPLDSLGVEGAGKPEETREFIRRLKECGLHDPGSPLAFWLLHHFNKVAHKSVVQQLSGAWGGHPDTILGIEMGDGQTTKLTWAKLRWATPPKEKTTVLAWDVERRGFNAVDARFSLDKLRADVLEYVQANPGRATSLIQKSVVGGNQNVRDALDWLSSDQGGRVLATGPGEAKNGIYWFPNNQAVLDLSTGPVESDGERGERFDAAELSEPLSTDPLHRDGERGERVTADPHPSLDEGLATTSSPCKGGRGGGGEDEVGDPPLATTSEEAELLRFLDEVAVQDDAA